MRRVPENDKILNGFKDFRVCKRAAFPLRPRTVARILTLIAWTLLGAMLFGSEAPARAARREPGEVRLTLLHTNDLHSQYRPGRDPLGLGGISRLKTLVARLRSENENTLLVDAGDWSEGSVYYTLGAGTESLRMMEALGYDVALIGNHDWLNGPDQLLKSIDQTAPSLALIGGNFDLSAYPRADQFARWIQPYTIREFQGLKVAFIGVATYEFVFDSFMSPVKILDPYAFVRQVASRLRDQVDVIIAISHNSVSLNENLLKAAPDVDLVIGAHDHLKLTRPIVVRRKNAADGWVVEAGCWGRYLGRVDLTLRPRDGEFRTGRPTVSLDQYRLYPVDASLTQDPDIEARVAGLEGLVSRQLGPVFDDHVADNETHVFRKGAENRMGNLTTDAFLKVTGADFALDQSNFIYGELHPGELRSVDVLNSNPAIYDPQSGHAWTLKTFEMTGKTLRWLLNVLFSHQLLAEFGVLSESGMSIVYDPMLRSTPKPEEALRLPAPDPGPVLTSSSIIQEVKIQGKPLDPARSYKVAASGGVMATLKFLDTILPNAVPISRVRDTGLEGWRVMIDHLRAISPVTPDKIPTGVRIRSLDPDLAVFAEDIQVKELSRTMEGLHARVQVSVRNVGMSASPQGTRLRVLGDLNGQDTSRDPAYTDLVQPDVLPALGPLEQARFEHDLLIPSGESLGSVTLVVEPVTNEVNLTNNQAVRWLKSP